jgi:hypothetical protein
LHQPRAFACGLHLLRGGQHLLLIHRLRLGLSEQLLLELRLGRDRTTPASQERDCGATVERGGRRTAGRRCPSAAGAHALSESRLRLTREQRCRDQQSSPASPGNACFPM